MEQNIVMPELAVCGAGVVGCLAAVAAAEAGRKVVVLEKRAYPGREIAAYNHSFVRRGTGDRALRKLSPDIQQIFSLTGSDDVLVPEGFIRQRLLRLLEARKIPVLFEAEAAGVTASGRLVDGVLAAAPPGLVRLPVRAAIDASERAHLVRLAAGIPYLPGGAYTVHAVFEWELPAAARQEALALPRETLAAAERELGLAGDSIRFHAALRSDTLTAEFAFVSEVAVPTVRSLSRMEERRQELTLALGVWLRKHVAAFAAASLSYMAYECRPIGRELPPGTDGGFDNLLAVPELPWGFSLDDVAAIAEALPAMIAALPLNPEPETPASVAVTGAPVRVKLSGLKRRNDSDAGLPVALQVIEWNDALPIPETLSCDVCVAGLGTTGGTAMIAAAEHGLDVIATELHQIPGGTFAPGRVIGLYGGYQGGVFERYRAAVATQESVKLQAPGPGGMVYSEFLRSAAASHGAAVYGGTRLCGVKCDAGRVEELLFANESGLFSVRPGITVDATGNADVAALAGAGFDLGDPEDGMLQSFSMWGAESFPVNSWLGTRYSADPDVVSPVLYSERLRAIALGHRENSLHHIAPMATIREGRRIHGEAALRLNDILNRRIPADTVAVATTSCDSHAFLSSPLANFTAIGGAKMMPVRIPFGCFVPQGLEGVLVGAKAISGERDATSFCRMNADTFNQGYSLGYMAAAALAAGGRVRGIDVTALQEELRTAGVLPDWAFRNDPTGVEASAAEVLTTAGMARFDDMLTFSAAEALPLLEARYRRLPPVGPEEDVFASEHAAVCMALAWYGSAVGGEFLRELLTLAQERKMHLTVPPVNPDRMRFRDRHEPASDYHRVNRLLVMAGKSGDGGFTPLLARLIGETPGMGEAVARLTPYDATRKDVPIFPYYRRLKGLAFAVERHPDTELVPALDALLRRCGAGEAVTRPGSAAAPAYMTAHLGLCLARAACRCGSRAGEKILTGYLDDVHVFFRENARRVLRETSGR